MKNNSDYSFITYALLSILIIFIFSLSFKYKFKTAQNLSFRSLTNKNSNSNSNNLKEGFSFNNTDNSVTKNSSKVETETLFKIIDNKLKGLMQELGGDDGNAETKKLLTSTKKICDLECAKCMVTMINEQKSIKTIDLENIMEDETNENCLKCKKYTHLSKSIDGIITNL